jgi:hypothetical protein
VNRIVHVLIGDLPTVGDVAIKTAALFLTAAILFRFTERRTLAEFAPFDWIAAVAAGAIVGRAATATDTACGCRRPPRCCAFWPPTQSSRDCA